MTPKKKKRAKWVDPVEKWPLCAVCGKKPREGNHATDYGGGHDYVPGAKP